MNNKYYNVFVRFMRFVSGMLWISSTEGNRYIVFCNDKGDLMEFKNEFYDWYIKALLETFSELVLLQYLYFL